jgi:hypothetical protein
LRCFRTNPSTYRDRPYGQSGLWLKGYLNSQSNRNVVNNMCRTRTTCFVVLCATANKTGLILCFMCRVVRHRSSVELFDIWPIYTNSDFDSVGCDSRIRHRTKTIPNYSLEPSESNCRGIWGGPQKKKKKKFDATAASR